MHGTKTRTDLKSIRKDQTVRREVLDELAEATHEPARTEPRYRSPNRDQARGDWDRSGGHTGGEA
jgi:hypothetical protein